MRKILIAAGGTGGHIYPALAMAEAFLRKEPDARIAFVGTAHGLENKIIPPKGFVVHHLPIGRLNSNVGLAERLGTVLKMPLALLQSARLLRREKPDFVLGVGGHASGPLLLVAAFMGYRTGIWEPNAMPGLANRWLARFVGDSWVVFEEARAFLGRGRSAGVPVRREIEEPRAAAAPDGRFHILVFGGSQGARGINNCTLALLQEGGDWLKDVHVVHQTGPADFARIRDGYAQFSAPVEVHEYLHDMAARYARADLVICRSGTGTLSELAACGKPAILIPFPFASDDHQRKNAESLVKKGAAVMIVQKDLTPERLRAEIVRLKQDRVSLSEMGAAVRGFHRPQAAEKLVDEFVERMGIDASR